MFHSVITNRLAEYRVEWLNRNAFCAASRNLHTAFQLPPKPIVERGMFPAPDFRPPDLKLNCLSSARFRIFRGAEMGEIHYRDSAAAGLRRRGQCVVDGDSQQRERGYHLGSAARGRGVLGG